jgi:hypothetical protein
LLEHSGSVRSRTDIRRTPLVFLPGWKCKDFGFVILSWQKRSLRFASKASLHTPNEGFSPAIGIIFAMGAQTAALGQLRKSAA